MDVGRRLTKVPVGECEDGFERRTEQAREEKKEEERDSRRARSSLKKTSEVSYALVEKNEEMYVRGLGRHEMVFPARVIDGRKRRGSMSVIFIPMLFGFRDAEKF